MLDRIRPRSIVFLFSGGKDSSLALLLARDTVKEYIEKTGAKAYIVYIYVTGNTHPANAYCASSVMLWHRKNYGFQPVWLASSKVFQEYVARYGLQKGPGRWCYTEFKEKPLRELHRRLPKPILYVDGMDPSDSRRRAEVIKSEFELIHSRLRGDYWSWHPLYSRKLSSKEKLAILEKHDEFRCVVNLYKLYMDSMNCVLCPYRTSLVDAKHSNENILMSSSVAEFLALSTRNRQWKRLATVLATPPIWIWMKNSRHEGGDNG